MVKVCSAANIPVTAKIRVGIDHSHETFMEAGHIAQEEGCAAVTLHARTTAEYYGGHSDWSRIGELVGALDIPVFGNGDIWGADDALEMVRETGCAGVAIGRGCQGPAVAVRRYQERLRGQRRARQPYAGGRMRRDHAPRPAARRVL